MDQRIIDLYDDFVHVHFDRRLFLERAAKVLGSTAAAAAALPLLQSNYALAEVIKSDDARIKTERVTFKGASGDLKAYLAAPKPAGKRGGVVMVHQNRGLNPHMEDLARRLAVDGFEAVAVDFLSPQGGTPTDEDAAMKMFGSVDRSKAAADAIAAQDWLRGRPDSNGKVGMIGFCWGGGIVNLAAQSDPKLDAGVVFYGDMPPLDKVKDVKAPLLLNYADPKIDTRLGAGLPGYEEALKAAHVRFTLHVYEGVNHAFNDDTGARYNEAAARTAWSRSLAFLKQHLA
jgi:carboxymethylenebutenolidase